MYVNTNCLVVINTSTFINNKMEDKSHNFIYYKIFRFNLFKHFK